jgi:hypothetical protein
LGLSQVELMLPVASLVVDDPEQRRAAGPEFQSVPKPQDIAATRRNMLGPRVLDAAQYPLVRVRGRLIGGRLPDFEAELAIEVRGAVRRIVVPVRVEIGPVEIVAVGELRLRQSDFGIQPYSVLMGNLRVQDEFLIRYRLVAVRN